MKTILVASSKGGAGKTTLATNLAAYFALDGKRTVLEMTGLLTNLSDQDLEDISAYRFLRQNMPPAGKFYGEIRQEGVIFVGQRYGDMVDLNNIGEPIFRHTEIASGPNGERVIYLMQKEEKKPDALIKQFQQNYGIAPAS